MIHVVQNQMKYVLLNKQVRNITLVQLRYQICGVYQIVNDMSVYYYFSETKKKTLRFLNNIWLNWSIHRIFTKYDQLGQQA